MEDLKSHHLQLAKTVGQVHPTVMPAVKQPTVCSNNNILDELDNTLTMFTQEALP